ncbi:hypothetical protein [Paenibacillus sp. YSY-4.3]
MAIISQSSICAMRYQWKMSGRDPVFIQAGSGNRELERDMQNKDDIVSWNATCRTRMPIVRRFLREAIPFGGFIKYEA